MLLICFDPNYLHLGVVLSGIMITLDCWLFLQLFGDKDLICSGNTSWKQTKHFQQVVQAMSDNKMLKSNNRQNFHIAVNEFLYNPNGVSECQKCTPEKSFTKTNECINHYLKVHMKEELHHLHGACCSNPFEKDGHSFIHHYLKDHGDEIRFKMMKSPYILIIKLMKDANGRVLLTCSFVRQQISQEEELEYVTKCKQIQDKYSNIASGVNKPVNQEIGQQGVKSPTPLALSSNLENVSPKDENHKVLVQKDQEKQTMSPNKSHPRPTQNTSAKPYIQNQKTPEKQPLHVTKNPVEDKKNQTTCMLKDAKNAKQDTPIQEESSFEGEDESSSSSDEENAPSDEESENSSEMNKAHEEQEKPEEDVPCKDKQSKDPSVMKNKHEEDIVKMITDLSKELYETRSHVDKEENIEGYVMFLQKNIKKAYAIWSLGELTMKKHYYEQFFNFTIEKITSGTENVSMQLLYKNELIGSKNLVFYMIIALVHLGRTKEAYGILKFWILHWNDKKKIKEEIGKLKDEEWLQIPDQDPKENPTEILKVFSKERKDGSNTNFLFAALIAIKVQVILEMKSRLKDRTLVFKAFDRENSVTIATLNEKYPELKEAKLHEVGKIILEGMDLATYEKSEQNQINQLWQLIEACHGIGSSSGQGIHPSFIKEILNSNNEIVTKMHEYHLDQDIHRQSCEHASLASCVSYFAKIFCDKKDIHEIVKEKVDSFEFQSSEMGFASRILKRKRHNSSSGEDKKRNEDSGETPIKKTAKMSSGNDFVFDHDLHR